MASPCRQRSVTTVLYAAVLLAGLQSAAALRLLPALQALAWPWTQAANSAENHSSKCKPSQVNWAALPDEFWDSWFCHM